MSIPYEWRINDIERDAKRACDALWKIDTLRSDVGSLEYTVRELGSCVNGLRSICEAQQERIERLERQLGELANSP